MKYKGRFGNYGGFYVPEVLIPALEELEEAFYRFYQNSDFVNELAQLYKNYAGRPTPLYHAKRFSEYVGFNVYLKREDLLHGGAHKVREARAVRGRRIVGRRLGAHCERQESGGCRECGRNEPRPCHARLLLKGRFLIVASIWSRRLIAYGRSRRDRKVH